MNPAFISKCIEFKKIHGSRKELVVILGNEFGIVSVLGMNSFLCLLLSVFLIEEMLIKKSEPIKTENYFSKIDDHFHEMMER